MLTYCPECGKLVAARFPIHDCQPQKEAPVPERAEISPESGKPQIHLSWNQANQRWMVESWPEGIWKELSNSTFPGIRKRNEYNYSIATTDLGKVLRLLVDRGYEVLVW